MHLSSLAQNRAGGIVRAYVRYRERVTSHPTWLELTLLMMMLMLMLVLMLISISILMNLVANFMQKKGKMVIS